jgi:uncharacterized protein YkwD
LIQTPKASIIIKVNKLSKTYSQEMIMFKKNLLIFLIALGMISEGSSFAAKRDRRYYECPTEAPEVSEARCIEEINVIRQQHGLKQLKAWDELSDCARGHSQNMADKRCHFGHDGFDDRFNHMASVSKLSSMGENVAYNQGYSDPVMIAVESWMDSKGHRGNLLGNHEETGVGVAISKDGKFYITQLFATRRQKKSRNN